MSSEPPESEQEELKFQPIVQIDLTPEFYRNLRDLDKRFTLSILIYPSFQPRSSNEPPH
jgi:hypothetical protein